MRRASMFAFSAMIILFFVSPSYSGDWISLERKDEFNGCNYAFMGEIKKGDLLSLLNDQEFVSGYRSTICLNSPGGSLGEVYDFIRRAEEGGLGFATRVRSEDQCLSACAILFMFGQSYGANSPIPDRFMEPGARLGFHSPFIPGTLSSQVEGGEAFRIALDVAKLLVDRSYTAITIEGAALPSEIVALILGTPGDKMRIVDAIGELKLLNIRTIDYENGILVPFTREGILSLLQRVCASSYALTFRQYIVKDGYSFDEIVDYVNDLKMSRSM